MLTQKQNDVLYWLQKGYRLRWSNRFGWRMRRDRGSKETRVHHHTAHSLISRGLLREANDSTTVIKQYVLTAFGYHHRQLTRPTIDIEEEF